MPMMQDSLSVAANSVSSNVLAGKLYEAAPEDSAIRVYCCGSAIGLRQTFSIGGQQITDDEAVNSANRFPVVPDDLCVEHGAYAGEKLFLRFRNSTAGALTTFWMVVIEPV